MEKRWPPERLKSFEAPRLFIACATRRPPWTRRLLASTCSVAIEAETSARSRPARGGRRGQSSSAAWTLRSASSTFSRARSSFARSRSSFFSAAASLRSASLRRFACCWRARRSAASRSLPFFRVARRRGCRRADQPDPRRPLLACQPAVPDRLGDLRVAGRGLQGLRHPGQDLVPHPVLATDRLGGARAASPSLSCSRRADLAQLLPVGRAGQHLLLRRPQLLPHLEQLGDLLGLPHRQLVDEPGCPARLAPEP